MTSQNIADYSVTEIDVFYKRIDGWRVLIECEKEKTQYSFVVYRNSSLKKRRMGVASKVDRKKGTFRWMRENTKFSEFLLLIALDAILQKMILETK